MLLGQRLEEFTKGIRVRGGFDCPREEGVGKKSFLLLKLVNAIFDCAGADEFVNEDGFVLPDTVSSVGSLCLSCGIPPWVKVDHGIGGSQVEASPAGFEGDEKDRNIFVLETLDQITAVF